MIRFEFIPKEEIEMIIPLLHLLNPEISKELLQERLIQMIEINYQCIGIYNEEKLIGICGIWVLVKYYVGKHIELDNVLILPEYQKQNIGHELMLWVEKFAQEQGCNASELNCYVGNDEAHKFWERESYEVIALHFQKKFIK